MPEQNGRHLVDKSNFLNECYDYDELAPGRSDWNFGQAIVKMISVIDNWDISCEISLRGIDDNLAFVWVLTDPVLTQIYVALWRH